MAHRSFDQLSESEEVTDSDSEHVPATKRSRGLGKIWTKEQEFDSRTAAVDFIKSETKWRQWYRYDTADGINVQYRCKTVKNTGQACPALIKLLYHCDRETVSLYRTDEEHDHSDAVPARGLDPYIRSAVEQLYKDGVKKPNAILLALAKRQLPQPPKIQLKNFLQNYRLKTEAPPMLNIGELEEWCNNRSQPCDEDPNAAFVVQFSAGVTAEGTASLKLFMSSPRLLESAASRHVLHVDASSSLNWEDMPVTIVGTTDLDRQFHPIGISLTSDDNAEDYAFIFRAIVAGVKKVSGVDYRPDVLIADAVDAVTNGFGDVFGGQFKRITCWTHVMRAIDKELHKIGNDDFRQRIRDDIGELQLCGSEEIFDAVLPLFFAKWHGIGDGEIDTFLHYFRGHWTVAHKNWYEGYLPNIPSTNYVVESISSLIKHQGTLRNRVPITQFLDSMDQSIIQKWSYERDPANPACKWFAHSVTKSTDMWKKSYLWAKKLSESKRVLSKSRDACWRDYYIPSRRDAALSPAAINEFRAAFANLQWNTFGQYTVMRNQIWVVSIFENSWETATCSCPSFLKEFVCKHSLGVAIWKEYCVVPSRAKTGLVGKKRRFNR